MDVLKTQLAQLIISILVLIGIFVLIVLGKITTSDPVFIVGGSSALAIILYHWFSVGQRGQQHAQMMEAIAAQSPGQVSGAPMSARDQTSVPQERSVQREPAPVETQPMIVPPALPVQ